IVSWARTEQPDVELGQSSPRFHKAQSRCVSPYALVQAVPGARSGQSRTDPNVRRELLALKRRVTHTYFVLCGTWGCSARAQHPAAPSLPRTPCSAACEERTARTVDGLPADASLAGRIPSTLRLSATAA